MTACIVFGPAWGWLLGLFVLAHLRVYGDPVRAAEFSVPVADHLRTYGLGTPVRSLTETLPSLREGASLKPWTVAELLRAWDSHGLCGFCGAVSTRRKALTRTGRTIGAAPRHENRRRARTNRDESRGDSIQMSAAFVTLNFEG